MSELSDTMQYLCNSSQRIRILNALDNTNLDLRDLMAELESPRSTLQRNLSTLEERGWIEETQAGYKVTTAGVFIREKATAVDEMFETINEIAPFLSAIDDPATLDINQLKDTQLIVPAPSQPNAPIERLLNTFEETDHVRGCLPVVSWILSEIFIYKFLDDTHSYEYIFSKKALESLRGHSSTSGREISQINRQTLSDLYVYTDELPYGLFITDDRLVLIAYTAVGRIHAMIESANETTIEWGEEMFDQYKQQSNRLPERHIIDILHNSGAGN